MRDRQTSGDFPDNTIAGTLCNVILKEPASPATLEKISSFPSFAHLLQFFCFAVAV